MVIMIGTEQNLIAKPKGVSGCYGTKINNSKGAVISTIMVLTYYNKAQDRHLNKLLWLLSEVKIKFCECACAQLTGG